MATDSTGNRRHFLGAAAAALVAAGVGVGFGCAKAQSSTPQLQGSEGNMPSLSGATDWLRERRFEIEFLDPGVEAYTFTFG